MDMVHAFESQHGVDLANLSNVGQLAQVELVVELDRRRQEVVHDMAMQLNGGIHQFGTQLHDLGVKAALVQVSLYHGAVDRSTSAHALQTLLADVRNLQKCHSEAGKVHSAVSHI